MQRLGCLCPLWQIAGAAKARSFWYRLWSTMTLASAFAPNLGLLMLFRSGVGFGEAALIPSAIALIASMFAIRLRARAAFFSPALIWVARFRHRLRRGQVPISRVRWTFACAIPRSTGALAHRTSFSGCARPGFRIHFWVTAREPKSVVQTSPELGGSWSDAFHFMANRRAWVGFSLGLLATAIYFSGHQTWFPIYLIRHFHENPAFVGRVYFFFALLSALGTMAGPLVTTALLRRGFLMTRQ